MSEASDDAPQEALEVVPPAPVDAPSDADDVEVLAQAPEPEPTPRHDSVSPTSRKLAPPPKPKRDSNQPGSVPPSAGDGTLNVGSLKAPSAPSISFQDAAASSREAVAAALAGSDSLRSIGEALAKDAGAFSTTEVPTGGRPPVPRPRSQSGMNAVVEAPLSGGPETRPSQDMLGRSPSEPPRPRDKVPTVPDEPVASSPAPNSSSIFAQRIIAVGTSTSERPPARASAPPPALGSAPPPPPAPVPPPPAAVPPPAAPVDLDSTLEAAEDRPSRPSVPPLPALNALGIAPIDVTVDDDAPPDIPITTDFDDETPTLPSAAPNARS